MSDEDNSEHEYEHGQTYGEAVDETLEECAAAVEAAHEKAERLREQGKTQEAFIIEAMADLLARDALKLARKRDRMPFGLESAQGFGEAMENPTLSFLERTQREETDE